MGHWANYAYGTFPSVIKGGARTNKTNELNPPNKVEEVTFSYHLFFCTIAPSHQIRSLGMKTRDHKEGRMLCTTLGCPPHGTIVGNLRCQITSHETYLTGWCVICLFRTSFHYLEVGTDIWKRQNVPWKDRVYHLCDSGTVQDEQHVVFEYRYTDEVLLN